MEISLLVIYLRVVYCEFSGLYMEISVLVMYWGSCGKLSTVKFLG